MTDQLSFFLPHAPPSPGMPPAIARIIQAARSLPFGTRVGRGSWGIGVGPKRRWVRTGDCCCPLAALLVAESAQCEQGENSASCAVARTLGIDPQDVYRFIDGFDGQRADDGSEWFGYGRRVAEELGVQ